MSGSSTVIEHNSKIEGSNPTAGTRREHMTKILVCSLNIDNAYNRELWIIFLRPINARFFVILKFLLG